jgi:hypothetical protein
MQESRESRRSLLKKLGTGMLASGAILVPQPAMGFFRRRRAIEVCEAGRTNVELGPLLIAFPHPYANLGTISNPLPVFGGEPQQNGGMFYVWGITQSTVHPTDIRLVDTSPLHNAIPNFQPINLNPTPGNSNWWAFRVHTVPFGFFQFKFVLAGGAETDVCPTICHMQPCSNV